MIKINPDMLAFYKDLEKNNNREWFEKQKSRYKALETELKVFNEEAKGKSIIICEKTNKANSSNHSVFWYWCCLGLFSSQLTFCRRKKTGLGIG